MLVNRNKSQFLLLSMVAVIYVFSACENNFEPLQENDRYHFSIFGALDLSADTQWVRVMPLTESLYMNEKKPIDAEVKIRRVSTGEEYVMSDSLIQYSTNIFAWNFWTTEPLYEEEEYEVIAENSEGEISRARATIPPDFPMPVVDYSEEDESGIVTGSGVENMAVADIFYDISIANPCDGFESPIREVVVSHKDRVNVTTIGIFRFYPNDRATILGMINTSSCDRLIIHNREALVVSADENWPHYKGLSEDEIFLPDVASNVEDGLGVVTAIVSKRFPLESCYDEEGELIACPPNE